MNLGHQSFILAAMDKPTDELRTILGDPDKLRAAAEYHNISEAYAAFYIGGELRSQRRAA